MSLRVRLLLVTLAVYAVGGYFITRWVIDQVRPRYLESMEETLVDTSVLLASMLEARAADGLDPATLRESLRLAQRHEFVARVFSLRKTHIDLRVYVTDARGFVVFDSTGRDEGRDYSQWNDVARTLRGEYGARSSRDVPGDDDTQVIYVAAPIKSDARILGVVSVGKPTRGINELVSTAKRRIALGAVTGGAILLCALVAVMGWIVAPLERLTAYARAVRDGRPAALPNLPGRTLQVLAHSFEEMRDALEGRQHAERYTRALAHEIKAPLAAIRGAAELMDESMPEEERRRFLGNVRHESGRIQLIVERLLELSAVESRKSLGTTESIPISGLVREVAEAMQPAFAAAGVALNVGPDDAGAVDGDRFLLRQALLNFLQNALEFSAAGASVAISAERDGASVVFSVEDQGPGIPEYALGRVFDTFYSLPRPGGTRKSTGIGLALVREIAHLHGGEAAIVNRPERGARATLTIPLAASRDA